MTSTYRAAPDVAWLDAADLGHELAEAYVARIPDGQPLVLEGAAWAVWIAVTDGGSAEAVVTRVAELIDAPAEDVAEDVRTFLASLVDQGLVSREPALGD